jgi:phosphatidylglycerophosphatase A
VLAGFALFRLFDIWKPWPIGWVDRRVQGGLGIMLDDVIAGVMACLLLHAALALGIPLL